MKVAVVGAGVSGLVCALGLKHHHHVTVFDADHRAGGHANTRVVKENGRSIGIDTGFIVFNFKNYPHLSSLFDRLGVSSQPSDMSFSVRCDKSGFEFSGSNLNTFFAQRSNLFRLEAWQLLRSIFAFHRDGNDALRKDISDEITVGEFAKHRGYRQNLVEHYLLPLGGALWSCSSESFSQFPVRFFLEFLRNHSMLQMEDRPVWRTVSGGSQQYVTKIVSQLESELQLDHRVSRVTRVGGGVDLEFHNGKSEHFDEVVLATHADTSLNIIQAPDAEESELLSAFPYQDNVVTLHTDTRVLPKAQRAWASWNYRVRDDASAATGVTYNMNKLQALDAKHTYCVSLNQHDELDQDHILRREVVRHPLFTPGRDEFQKRHHQVIRRQAISFCGAYWGFGFHEDGVRSAIAVCDAFGVERPC